MPNSKVLVVGDACIDVHLSIQDILHEDSFQEMPHEITLGGTGVNTAVYLSKLGIDTSFLGTVGNDYAGKKIIELLNLEGVDTSLIRVDEKLNTVSVFAFIDEKRERHLWGYPRVKVSYASLDLNDFDLTRLKEYSWIHTSGMSLLKKGSIQESSEKIFEYARKNNITTSLDFNTRVNNLEMLDKQACQTIENLIPNVNYLLGSMKDEFYSFHPQSSPRDSVRYFVCENRTCIARDGKEGYFLVNDKMEVEGSSYDIEVLDSTGAGDTFNAGFIAGMCFNLDVKEAAELGNATAAYKISHDNSNTLCYEKIEYFKNHAVKNR